MVAIAALVLEIRIQHAQSLKDKRQVIRSLKDRLRGRFNVSVAETDFQGQWQLAEVVVVTVASSRQIAESTLRGAEDAAAEHLMDSLVRTNLEWLE